MNEGRTIQIRLADEVLSKTAKILMGQGGSEPRYKVEWEHDGRRTWVYPKEISEGGGTCVII